MSLPSGYTRLEYIESTGTQYIDTGFKPNQDTRVVIDVQLTASPSKNCWLFEGRNAASATGAGKGVFLYRTATGQWTSDYGGSKSRLSFSKASATDRLKVDYNKNVCTINGETKTHAASTFQSNYPMFLLADDNAGTANGISTAKLYSCKVYDNGALVRDFIPAKDASGMAGLWDTVNSLFYTNAGTGVFVAGPIYLGVHKATVNGTAYDITKGKCLVNGTAYSIKKGRTLVGGTGYDIAFDNRQTWLLNKAVSIPTYAETYNAYFVCNANDTKYSRIVMGYHSSDGYRLQYQYIDPSGAYQGYTPYRNGSWDNESARTVTFDEPPTGALLTWLQANAVQQ